MTFDALLHAERPRIERRLRRMVRDPETAADLTQEALLRAWRSAPRGGSPAAQRAWLHRTAANLAIDALRARRPTLPLDAAGALAAPPGADAAEAAGARDAVARLSAHERFVLLLRFDAGLSYREIGALLGLSEEAARKRVARARQAFVAAWRAVRSGDDAPLILLVEGEDRPRPYRRWLEAHGARVRVLRRDAIEREVAVADGLVFCGSVADVAPETYGERPWALLRDPDAARDRTDLAVLRLALRDGLPLLGVCRGAQLLNVAFGGTLHQDLALEGIGSLDHDREVHAVGAASGSRLRALVGARSSVRSEHHQAVRRLGRGLRAVGRGPDGVVEAVERPGGSLALGVQWHPEAPEAGETGAALAETLIAEAGRASAA